MGGAQSSEGASECCGTDAIATMSPFERLKIQARYGQALREAEERMERVTHRHDFDELHQDANALEDHLENWEEWDRLLDEHPDLMEAGDDEGNTLLHIAINSRHHEAARRLILRGSSWAIPNNEGVSAFELAKIVPKNARLVSMILKLERERRGTDPMPTSPPRAICHAHPSFSRFVRERTYLRACVHVCVCMCLCH